jgi:hypothetical protein
VARTYNRKMKNTAVTNARQHAGTLSLLASKVIRPEERKESSAIDESGVRAATRATEAEAELNGEEVGGGRRLDAAAADDDGLGEEPRVAVEGRTGPGGRVAGQFIGLQECVRLFVWCAGNQEQLAGSAARRRAWPRYGLLWTG